MEKKGSVASATEPFFWLKIKVKNNSDIFMLSL